MRHLVLLAVFSVCSSAVEITATIAGEPYQLHVDDAGTRAVRGASSEDLKFSGRIVVGLAAGEDAATVARRHGLRLISQGPTWAVLAPTAGADATRALRALPQITERWTEPEFQLRRVLKGDPTDTRFAAQWYLKNNGILISGSVAGHDLNIVPAWDAGITGNGVRIGVIDDGFDLVHEDLSARFDTANDYDFLGNDADPSPGVGDFHGTAVSGFIAAGRNGLGIVGAAYDSTLVGLRLIGTGALLSQYAEAFTWKQGTTAELAISSNSWGPGDDGVDDGAANEGPTTTESNALASAATSGRGGKGTVFVFAAGNGGDDQDVCDRDGYASSPYVIAVGATNANGTKADYSERGTCLFITAGVGDTTGEGGLTTLKMGTGTGGGNYGEEFGTSFSCPQISGVIALMLQKRPALTRRDVRRVLAASAEKNDATNPEWQTTGVSYHWHPSYGFGQADAAAAVTLSETWAMLPAAANPVGVSITPNVTIPDATRVGTVTTPRETAEYSLTISAESTYRIDNVLLTVDCTHQFQGDLSFVLTSPSGTTATIEGRRTDSAPARRWTFHPVGFLGETAAGVWKFKARDVFNTDEGTLNGVALTINGYLPDGSAGGGATGSTTGLGTGVGTTGATSTSGGSTSTGGTGSSSSDGGGSSCGMGSGLALAFGSLLFAFRQRLRRS
jgi:subtilisin family serine protease